MLWIGVFAVGFFEIVIHRGHSARFGKLDNGAYFLGSHGRYIELSASSFRTSMWIDAAFHGFMLSLAVLILGAILVHFAVELYKQTRPDPHLQKITAEDPSSPSAPTAP